MRLTGETAHIQSTPQARPELHTVYKLVSGICSDAQMNVTILQESFVTLLTFPRLA